MRNLHPGLLYSILNQVRNCLGRNWLARNSWARCTRAAALLCTLPFILPLVQPLIAQPLAAQPPPERLSVPIMPLSQIQVGMTGEAYTVFQGTRPEKMGVEVLGILRNMAGPKGDVILVRLKGAKAEYTGVVAGMSGSPVYIDG